MRWGSNQADIEYEVVSLQNDRFSVKGLKGNGVSVGHIYTNCHADNIIIVRKNTMASKLIERAVLAVTPEPQRSLRRAGITNGDNILTDEGVKVFLSWLLSQNIDAFKKEVVDAIIEDMKDEC